MDRKNLTWVICGVLVFTIPFYLHYIYLLNMFYHFGAPINDAGIFANLSWHGDWKLTPPLTFTNFSFFGVHCSPILILLNEISYISPAGMVEHYSMFLAMVYAATAYILFYAFYMSSSAWKYWHIYLIAIISALFAFNNTIMSGIWFGHIEYAIPPGIFLFLLFYYQKKLWPSIAAFVFTLSIREDAGLHLTAALGLLALIKLKQTRSLKTIKPELYFIIAAILYSVFAFWVASAARDYYGSTFQLIYTGTPAYAHLSFQLLAERAGKIASGHLDIVIGFIATLAMAIYTRNIYLMVGFAAYIPWLIINWTAANPNTGELYAYYSFPFILSLMWPIMGAIWKYGLPLPEKTAKQMLLLQTILVAGSLIALNDDDKSLEFGPVYGARFGSYAIQEGTKHHNKVLEFFELIRSGGGDFGTIMADQGSITMVKGGKYKGQDILRLESDKPADTIIAMLPDHQYPTAEITQQAEKNHLTNKYCIDGTTICVFTNRAPKTN